MVKPKLMRITTTPQSLAILLKGQHKYMQQYYDVIGVSSHGDQLENIAVEDFLHKT